MAVGDTAEINVISGYHRIEAKLRPLYIPFQDCSRAPRMLQCIRCGLWEIGRRVDSTHTARSHTVHRFHDQREFEHLKRRKRVIAGPQSDESRGGKTSSIEYRTHSRFIACIECGFVRDAGKPELF